MRDDRTAQSGNSEESLARLLRLAGPRPEPTASARREVYEEVRAAWETQLRKRRARRRLLPAALAASLVALTAVWLWPSQPENTPPAARFAELDRGAVEIASTAGWQALRPGEVLTAGQQLRTGSERAGLMLASGISLRLDRNTSLRIVTPARAELTAGRIYIDTAARSFREAAIAIVAGDGEFRHVGTQFEIEASGRSAKLRVRDGIVILETASDEYVAARGQGLYLAAGSPVEQLEVASAGPSWDWTLEVAPHFDTDGRLVSELVAWAARETGREVVYADALTRNAAANTRIRGSVTGRSPEEVLAVALETTRFTYHLEETILSVDEHR